MAWVLMIYVSFTRLLIKFISVNAFDSFDGNFKGLKTFYNFIKFSTLCTSSRHDPISITNGKNPINLFHSYVLIHDDK